MKKIAQYSQPHTQAGKKAERAVFRCKKLVPYE
jgi:hypothetical protein